MKKEAANAYFDTSKLYTKMAFAQSFWTFGSLSLFYEQALLSDAVWNETHYRDPAFDKLIRDAQAAADETEAKALWQQVQQVQYDQGGYIVWANGELLDGVNNDVRGLTPNGWFNLGGYELQERLVRSVAWARASLPRDPVSDPQAVRATTARPPLAPRALVRPAPHRRRPADAVRRLDPGLRRDRGPAGRRRQRHPRRATPATRTSPRCAS